MNFRKFALLVATSFTLSAAFAVTYGMGEDASAGNGNVCKWKAPDGYSDYIVFNMNGILAPGEPTLIPGDSFFTNVLGYTGQEVQDFLDNMICEVETRYGIDVDDLESQGRVTVLMSETNPNVNYKAVVVAGKKVDSDGWFVREGTVLVIVNDPNGLDLPGGTYPAQHVPPGTAIGGGFYNIAEENKFGVPNGKEISIEFFAAQPISTIAPNPNATPIICEITGGDLGTGQAYGYSGPIVLGDGSTQANARNVLSFNSNNGI